MSEWIETTLGDLFEVDNSRLGSHSVEPTVMSLSKYDGFVRADDYFDKRIASEKLDAYKVVEPGEWAFSTIHIDEGSIARNNLGEQGVISPMYTTMRWATTDHLAEYGELLLREPGMLAEYGRRAQGSVNRRRSLSFKNFAAIPVTMPPHFEQRRIVDVLGAVDSYIDAMEAEMQRAHAFLQVSISETLAEMPRTRILGEFTTTRSGPSYSAADVAREPMPGSVPSIGIPNTKPDGSLDLSEVGHVSGLGDKVGTVDETSLVLIRTNGNRSRIGNVYLPSVAAHGHIVSAFQFLMKVDDSADREFVYWVLREPSMQAAMSAAASGTTGLGNLAVKWLNSARVYWTDDPEQRRSVTLALRAQQDVVDSIRDELARLRMFRSALLASLLNQDVEIPKSYDALLEAAS
ncbi:hypothetical protein ACPCG0_11495 [Propionibacteriaceae bacterium Y1923]